MRKLLFLIFSVASQIVSAQGIIGTANRWILVDSYPNKYYSIQINGVVSQIAITQGIIRTPKSLILVYNYPNNYFYIQVNGKDINITEKHGVLMIDKQLIQILAAHKSKFVEDTNKILSNKEFIEKYIKWEIDYIESSFSYNAKSKIEFLRSAGGKEIAFWTYEMPISNSEAKTDSSFTPSTQEQMFVLTKAKDFVVGIYSPLLRGSDLNKIKSYLLENIDGLVEYDKFIDPNELNKQINN
jgi:hypothetical protein